VDKRVTPTNTKKDSLNISDASESSLGKIIAISYLKEATTPSIPIIDTSNWYLPKSEIANILVMIGSVNRPTALAITVLDKSFSTFFENSDKFRKLLGIIIKNKPAYF
jgi:hypothetical protein